MAIHLLMRRQVGGGFKGLKHGTLSLLCVCHSPCLIVGPYAPVKKLLLIFWELSDIHRCGDIGDDVPHIKCDQISDHL